MKEIGKYVVLVTHLYFFTHIQHSCGAPRDSAVHEFSTHHQMVPLVYSGSQQTSSTLTKKGHLPDVTVVLTAYQKVFTLDLILNRHLLPANYTEKYFLPDGSSVVNTHSNHTLTNCYYHGDVRDSINSAVAVSTCDGLSGYFQDGAELFYIEPVEGALSGQHYVYRATDSIQGSITSIVADKAPLSHLGKLHSKLSRKKRSIHWPYDTDSDTRIVELYIVNDHAQFVANGRDISKTIRRTKDIINVVSSLYRAVNIYVALVGIEIWTEDDQISVMAAATDTMNNFLAYRRTSICPNHQNDNAQMITGQTFLNGVVGKATISGICSYQYSGGVDMDHSSLAVVAGTTIAHEMGHNFGLIHDGADCECPLPRCIMSPSSGGSETVTWSSCSIEQFADAFHQGFDYCLRNLPDQLYGEAYCGNGFMEEGEECDCGLEALCDTKCCDASTCRLTTNATCATGQCCDLSTCQLKAATTLCRGAKTLCDLPEFCDNKVEFCPSDVFLENGVSCENDVSSAFCYEGECRSHTSQCQLLWGKTGNMSHGQCYTHYNPYGAAYGHCGFNWVDKVFKKCAEKDVMCGMLHCTHRNEKLMFWSEQMSYTMPNSWLTVNGDKARCLGAVLDVGLDMFDPGMVPNGAKCGDNKLCVNHECVPVTSLDNPVCPDCNSHGVCNTLGQCHCNVGYAPPNCDKTGDGGSLHSGPSQTYSSSKGLLVGLLVFFLLILPLIAVAVFCGHRHRAHLKKLWRESAAKRYSEQARGGIWSVCRNVPRCDVIWKRSVKRAPSTNSTRQQPVELNRSASFRPEDISNPRNLNSTNKNIGPGGRRNPRNDLETPVVQVISGSHGNSSHGDNKLVPTRTAPTAPMPTRPAPGLPHRPIAGPSGDHDYHDYVNKPNRPFAGPINVTSNHDYVNKPNRPLAGPSNVASDHDNANKPSRPPPPHKLPAPRTTPQAETKSSKFPQTTAGFLRQPVASPRAQPTTGLSWQPPGSPGQQLSGGDPLYDNAIVAERVKGGRPKDVLVKPAVPVKPSVSRTESQSSRTGLSRPLEKPPPPPASSKPNLNK